MAEYYPLLARAIGSLPNSTPDSRRVVYERARKALIGQLRTMHPPIPDDDIENESVALDRAIERLESELANGSAAPVPPGPPAAPAPPNATPQPSDDSQSPAPQKAKPPAAPPAIKPPAPPTAAKPPAALKAPPLFAPGPNGKPGAPPPSADGSTIGPAERRLIPPLRTKPPKPPAPTPPTVDTRPTPLPVPTTAAVPPGDEPAAAPVATIVEAEATAPLAAPGKKARPSRTDPQRPIAPQPPLAQAPKRRLWIIPVAVVVVMAAVGYAAWKLRDHPETIAKGKPAEPAQADSGKIAERIGQPSSTPTDTTPSDTTPSDATPSVPPPASNPQQAPAAQPSETPGSAANTQQQTQQAAPATANPELPVAHRAALLVEAPDEPNKVKTFLGTVVWKLNNAPQGPNDAVGLEVEADIDLPDDKMKAVVTFAKNNEASLPASHTINVRYTVDPGSYTGDVKQISVPQMRPEASPSGEALAGVTVQIVPNAFLVGLSPGSEEATNLDLMRRLQWIDIPMLLDNDKIAKLTFEKSESGQRDLNEALDAWSKQ